MTRTFASEFNVGEATVNLVALELDCHILVIKAQTVG
jgi:hypothetical protein